MGGSGCWARAGNAERGGAGGRRAHLHNHVQRRAEERVGGVPEHVQQEHGPHGEQRPAQRLHVAQQAVLVVHVVDEAAVLVQVGASWIGAVEATLHLLRAARRSQQAPERDRARAALGAFRLRSAQGARAVPGDAIRHKH